MENGKDTGLPPSKRKKTSKAVKEQSKKVRDQIKKQGGRKPGNKKKSI